jgi:hypothetical protein
MYMAVSQPGGTILVYPEDEGIHQNGKNPVKAALRFRKAMVERGVRE